MKVNKIYLGDGAYAEFDGLNIVVTAENGIVATNTVYLEKDAILRLFEFCLAQKFMDPMDVLKEQRYYEHLD